MPMNPRIKALWTDALRSGKYPQGQGALCNVDLDRTGLSAKTLARKLRAKLGKRRTREVGIERCCLAVLADVCARSGEVTLEIEVTTDGERYNRQDVRYNGQAMLLPIEIIEWAGLDEYTDSDGTGGYDVRFDRSRPDDGDDYREYVTLSELNDSAGVPFTHVPDDAGDYEGIAELIDRCL